jgi:hypothetical protein
MDVIPDTVYMFFCGILTIVDIIDCARTFPPTTPTKGMRACYLYKLFRPEYLSSYKIPLSADAYSPFDKYDPMRDRNRAVPNLLAIL